MKTKEQVNPNGKPAFYAMCYSDLRKVALEYGYALALHGSLQNDMDLIAVAWVEDAKPMDELIKALEDCVGKTMFRGNNEFTRKQKPHGRVCYCISIGADTYIDLSVVDVISTTEIIKNRINSIKATNQILGGSDIGTSQIILLEEILEEIKSN